MWRCELLSSTRLSRVYPGQQSDRIRSKKIALRLKQAHSLWHRFKFALKSILFPSSASAYGCFSFLQCPVGLMDAFSCCRRLKGIKTRQTSVQLITPVKHTSIDVRPKTRRHSSSQSCSENDDRSEHHTSSQRSRHWTEPGKQAYAVVGRLHG
jgi:hypothetical protein